MQVMMVLQSSAPTDYAHCLSIFLDSKVEQTKRCESRCNINNINACCSLTICWYSFGNQVHFSSWRLSINMSEHKRQIHLIYKSPVVRSSVTEVSR